MTNANQKLVFVPFEFRDEIEKLSKAALMDMVWDFAFQMHGEAPDAAMAEIRSRREIINLHRARAEA